MSESCKRCGSKMRKRDLTIEERLDGFPVEHYFCPVCGENKTYVVRKKE